MDDVIADATKRFLDWYERDFGVRYTKEQLHGTRLSAIVPPEHKQTVLMYPHQKEFFKDLPVIENSISTATLESIEVPIIPSTC